MLLSNKYYENHIVDTPRYSIFVSKYSFVLLTTFRCRYNPYFQKKDFPLDDKYYSFIIGA